MRYMFLIYLDERAQATRSEAEIRAGMASHTPYIEMLRRNKKYSASAALGDARASRVLRSSGGKLVATEGPFAESREQFGGFYVVDASDLDDAIEVASQCPALKTVAVGIEIRPIPVALVAESPPADSERASHDRYLLAVYRRVEDAEARPPAVTEWDTWVGRLRASGRFAGAERLAPSGSATSLRFRDGKVALTDGPFVEGRDELGGYCMVWARDMDEAVGLGRECPDAGRHVIEVRPIRSAAG